MTYYIKYENTYTYPMVRFSSSVPNFDNDWSAWKENQEILAYEDAIFIALGMNDFSDYNINVHVFSSNIPLTNSNDSYLNFEEKIKNKVCLYAGTLFLEDRILDIGEEFDGFPIPTKTKNIYIKIYGASQSENRLELVCLIEEILIPVESDVTPWHIFTEQERHLKSEGLKKRYPHKLYVPFAYRQDNDDVACLFDGKVLIIHDYASPDWVARKNISLSTDEWVEMVLEEHNTWVENNWI